MFFLLFYCLHTFELPLSAYPADSTSVTLSLACVFQDPAVMDKSHDKFVHERDILVVLTLQSPSPRTARNLSCLSVRLIRFCECSFCVKTDRITDKAVVSCAIRDPTRWDRTNAVLFSHTICIQWKAICSPKSNNADHAAVWFGSAVCGILSKSHAGRKTCVLVKLCHLYVCRLFE